MKIAASIFKTLFLCLCIIANTHLAYAQTASILPQGKTQFLDNNGKPLTSGTVDFYIPSTTTRKTTWQNSAETVANSNPVVLDAGGRAIIYGDGSYRQVVKDRLGNVIWDQVTSSTGSGSGGSTATGDGDLVGTIKPWAGMTAPNQYVFTYGQEISRTTYSALFTAITSSQSVFCTSGSPTLTGLSDTTNFWVGASVEVSCLAAGFSTIISKTSSSITLASNANVSTNVTAIIFPWGRGNGTTTFNVPDLRGFAIAGNNNMGGVASSTLTTTYFGATDPNSVGAAGGSQSTTLVKGNMGSITPSGTITNGAITNGAITFPSSNGSAGAAGLSSNAVITSASVSGGVSLTVALNPNQAATTQATSTFTGLPVGGGIAVSATVGAVGSGYTNGSQTITVSGGTCTTQPQFTVTVAGNVFTGTPALLTAGSCTVAPNNPAATTGGGGTGGTLNVTYSAQPFSTIQPTKTSNYIIKITPDTNSATASGVTSLGGMTGSIACGTGLLCTGNNISSTSVTSQISIANYGGNGNGIADNTTAYNDFLAACVASTNRDCIIPPGVYVFNSQPNCISSNVHLYGGGGLDAVELKRDYNGAGNKGLICIEAGGGGTTIENLVILSAAGRTGGSMLSVIATTTTQISSIVLKDLRLTTLGSCTNDYSLYIDGTGATSTPIGVRDLSMINVVTFGANLASQALLGVAGLTSANTANYQAGCATEAVGLIIGGTAGVPSSTINITSAATYDGIWLYYASDLTINSPYITSTNSIPGVSIINEATVQNAIIYTTFMAGTDQANWTSSGVVRFTGGLYVTDNTIITPGVAGTIGQWDGGLLTGTTTPLISKVAAPVSPSAAFGTWWFDTTDLRLHDKNSAGVIGTTVVADTGAANNFITAISAAGVISKAQPSIANLSGLGVGVATALGVDVGTDGAFVVKGGALGSPSSAGTLPAFTLGGTISGGGNQINNVIIGTSNPLAGLFTTLSASTSLTSPLIIGGTGTTGTQLTFKTTTGVGTTDAYAFTGGSNGATTFATLNATGIGLGGAPSDAYYVTRSVAGAVTTGLTITGVNSTAGTTHTSKFQNQNQAGGTGRTLFFAASNNATNTQGEFDILTEDGNHFISQTVYDGVTAGSIFNLYNTAGTIKVKFQGTGVSYVSDGGFAVGTTSDPGAGMIYTNAATFMTRTKTSWTNGAAAAGGTLLNAPAAGNPTKWIPVDDNGTTRYIPAW